VLDDGKIKSEKRLFATATPRVYRTGLKKAAEEVGVEVVDMNDEKSFGKRFHTLTFGEAIRRDLLGASIRTNGKKASFIWKSLQNGRDIAEFQLCIRQMKVIDLAFGLGTKERLRTLWTLIVGNALRHCLAGHGRSCQINGKKASLI